MKTTMKTTMKMMAVMAVMMGFAFSAMGVDPSNTASGVITGNAVVAAAVTVTGTQALDFKNITPNVNKSIDAKKTPTTNRVTSGTVTGEEAQGIFTIGKGGDTSIQLELFLPANLMSGVNELKIEDYMYSLFATTETDAATIITGTAINITEAAFEDAYSASEFQLHLGATVKPTSSQVAGTYTENITLTATYN